MEPKIYEKLEPGTLLWSAPTRKNPLGFGNLPRVVKDKLAKVKKSNPATLLHESGSSPTNRGQDKLHHTLHWIGTFVWSNEAIILKRLGVKRRGWMMNLQQKGLVVRVPSGTRGGSVWVLSKEGLNQARSFSGQSYPHYPQRPERRQQTNLRHDLALQHIIADQIIDGKISAIFNGTHFSTGHSEEWIPDAIVKMGTKLVGMEYERNSKYGMAREQKLRRIVLFLNRSKQSEVLFISHSETCLNDYVKEMRNGVQDLFKLDRPESVKTMKLEKDLALSV